MKRHSLIGLVLTTFFIVLISQISTIATDDKIPFQPHPLPESLEHWQDSNNQGDYFDKIEAPNFGYLVFSNFPIKVYIENPVSDQNWKESITSAIFKWDNYLPLNLVEEPQNADIEIIRKNPPLDPQKKRASSAETRYKTSVKYTPQGFPYLSHRFTIWLSPTQTGKYIQAAVLHEFGHALGIWGHSPEPTDVMYFSQVREPPPISARDINTLKRIYQQPTRLGWPVL
ncbi:Peptidase M10A and M12B, matrixin and adamalysin [Planktothrix sp. PCC 11201]|uniref:matrixin family metalloprotease n=1 Tax=Planktothrix sp. PCC 11201 TaxID=1729650 RepID=UPI000923A676|nr:matrixin family metalloprotease [Planktothrix sp. PCC 11201]SKB13382.1 Peptidase M10A and M12B, matrixin and adamalysin [Planktothrix sp. PCC 11201]